MNLRKKKGKVCYNYFAKIETHGNVMLPPLLYA